MAKRDRANADGEPFRARVEVKHEFTTEQWKDKTDQLTRKMKDVELEEDRIKANAAEAKSHLKVLKAEVNELANQLRNGYEMVETDVLVEYDRKRGEKSYFFNAPGKPNHKKLVRKEAMTEEDFEQLVPLPEQPEPAKVVTKELEELETGEPTGLS